MSEFDSSLIILAGALGSGGILGYLTRIVKKVEDQKDSLYLRVMPKLYYNTNYFIEACSIFSKGGKSTIFLERIIEINTNLKEILSSGGILPSEYDFKSIFNFKNDLESLRDYLERINNNSETLELLQRSFTEGGEKFALKIDLKQMSSASELINIEIQHKLKKYKSFSWKLLILIFILAGSIAAIELIK